MKGLRWSVNARLLSMLAILAVMWVFFRLQVGDFYFSGESIAKLSRDMATRPASATQAAGLTPCQRTASPSSVASSRFPSWLR